MALLKRDWFWGFVFLIVAGFVGSVFAKSLPETNSAVDAWISFVGIMLILNMFLLTPFTRDMFAVFVLGELAGFTFAAPSSSWGDGSFMIGFAIIVVTAIAGIYIAKFLGPIFRKYYRG